MSLQNKNLKNFIGEYAFNIIKNSSVNDEAIKKALITPKNARNVFSDLTKYEIKSLCAEISNDGTIGQVRNTTQNEIIDAFNSAGYDTVIFDDKVKIAECKKYYAPNEIICTYNNLEGRMRDYHMMVAIKKDIDTIKRSHIPCREDEYGTSILNIQIAKNGSHMSIKNRYNHTVTDPDSTLYNNLDILHNGLQSMVLGYYNLASLNSKKSYYKNIVNINNIYLKYHTEKDNIYFGAFILDNINGARFIDSSRYYISEDNTQDTYYKSPLILDFKDKKVIDICQEEKSQNGRAILLTKTMQNGILTSANKEEINTISAIFDNSKQELLQCRKNALKFTYEMYGYDFTKPYKVTAILGKFTAKSIEKATGSNTGILLAYTREKIHVCKMTDGKFYTNDMKGLCNYNISTFYNQGDFEQYRKSGNAAVFIIQQEKQYIKTPTCKSEKYSYYNDSNKDEFDKSGCNLTETRRELSYRLINYKENKRKKEASEIDFMKDIAEISKLYNAFKLDILKYLTDAKTSEEYKILSSIMDYKIVWLVRDIENITKKALEKSFPSVESAQTKINEIKNAIIKMQTQLRQEH